MKKLYSASVKSVGGRNGKIESKDGILSFDVRMPKELGGEDGFTNPEQLFAAGYASCFGSALDLIASKSKLPVTYSEITADVSIGQTAEGGFALSVDLFAKIEGVEREKAMNLVEKAHEICPYSNAVRGNIDVNVTLV